MSQANSNGRLPINDSRERRKAIAAAVAKGSSPAKVAERFEVSIRTVQNACRENKVVLKRVWTATRPSAA